MGLPAKPVGGRSISVFTNVEPFQIPILDISNPAVVAVYAPPNHRRSSIQSNEYTMSLTPLSIGSQSEPPQTAIRFTVFPEAVAISCFPYLRLVFLVENLFNLVKF